MSNPYHDQSGRFTTGGGGATTAGAQHAFTIGAPGPMSNFTPDQVAEVQRAVDDAVARNPALLEGPNALQSVTFTSAHLEPGSVNNVTIKTNDGSVHVIPDGNSNTAAVMNMQAAGVTDINPQTPMEVQINDMRFGPTDASAPSTQSPYGVMTHELGHVEFAQDGVLTQKEAGGLMMERGFTPAFVSISGQSQYGASAPIEGMAELYSMQHVPGFSLPEPAGTSFATLESKLAANRPQFESQLESGAKYSMSKGFYWRYNERVPNDDSPELKAILLQAQRNIRAGRWLNGQSLGSRLFGGKSPGPHPSAGKLIG